MFEDESSTELYTSREQRNLQRFKLKGAQKCIKLIFYNIMIHFHRHINDKEILKLPFLK